MKMPVCLGHARHELLPGELLDRLDATPFMTRCREGRATRYELETFLIQQYHYSRHFTRYLCALLSNMQNETDRLALTGNLFDEMGFSHMGNIPHAQIYRDMLRAFDLDPASMPALAATRDMIATMFRLASDADPMTGLGALCLGGEAIVPHVYEQILYGLVSAGFPEKDLGFFSLHIDGDDDHALTMMAIIDRELRLRPASAVTLQAAARESITQRIAFAEAVAAFGNQGWLTGKETQNVI